MTTTTTTIARPTATALLARLAALGYAGHIIDDEYGRSLSAYSYAATRGTYGHPAMTLEWVAKRDANGDPTDLGWYREFGRRR